MADSRGVFDAEHWALTLGILLGVTLTAFEALAVVTVAPQVADALNGKELYGWIFSSFMLAALLSTVVGGQQADAAGPGRPFAVGLTLFGAGLLLSGFAPSMLVFIAGRVVQGLGGGAVVVALYAAVNVAYPDSLRPRLVALMSSAWVVPALVGPAAAGVVAQAVGWRVVFWGLVPLLGAVFALAMPSFARRRSLVRNEPAETPVLAACGLVLGTGALLYGLGVRALAPALLLVGGGVAASLLSLRNLMPEGTLRLAAGLPSVMASRGLFYAAFAGIQAFIALTLGEVHGFPASVAGLAIASGALSWTAGSWLQDRLDKRHGGAGRHRRVLGGTAVLSVGLLLQSAALFATSLPLVMTVAGWLVAGLGIGLAHSSSSVLAFALAPRGKEGAVSSSLQLADQFTAALSTGVGGALFAVAVRSGAGEQLGIFYAQGFSLLLVTGSVIAAYRVGQAGELDPRLKAAGS